LDAVLSGGSSPSVSLQLRHGPDVSANGTAVLSSPLAINSSNGGTTTGSVVSSFQSSAVPIDHWLWLEITDATGQIKTLTALVMTNSQSPP
jgi:hypothetical protein